MPEVNESYVPGRLCPICGRPLVWLQGPGGRRVRVNHARWDPAPPGFWERPVTRVVGRTGYEAQTLKGWEKTCDCQCTTCGIILDQREAPQGSPAPELTPRGYWVEGPLRLKTGRERAGGGGAAGEGAGPQATPANGGAPDGPATR